MRYKTITDTEEMEYRYKTRLWAIAAFMMGLLALLLALELINVRHEVRQLNGSIIALEQSVNQVIDIDKLITDENND